jgi:hypothetical protein
MSDLKEDPIEQLRVGSDIEYEFSSLAANFAYWSKKKAEAMEQVRKYESMLQQQFYVVYAEAKRDLGDKSKENECKAVIYKDEKYRKIDRLFREAKHVRDQFATIVEAFRLKASMLQQLGPLYRYELDSLQLGAPKHVVEENLRSKVQQVNDMVDRLREKKGYTNE